MTVSVPSEETFRNHNIWRTGLDSDFLEVLFNFLKNFIIPPVVGLKSFKSGSKFPICITSDA